MTAIEICLDTEPFDNLARQVRDACVGGAARIELCAHMNKQGLTPSYAAMVAAREAADELAELLVMIRPRDGDFCYSANEIQIMAMSILQAARAGADGVVFGCLDVQQRIDAEAMALLLDTAKSAGLAVTFHRAFDLIEDQAAALESLIEWRVNRLLSAGVPWGSDKGVLYGLQALRTLLQQADGRIELVIGGGLRAHHVLALREGLLRGAGQGAFSLHCHSAALSRGRVDASKVADLVCLAGLPLDELKAQHG
ncbi:copper homeostasis protein CutC [Aliiglaciecola sp. CAU 1673]|uniref:copper homeostasis protein CutC n=1 Tax=Aliiglaciecola sp. CAU 1673 TaxID=3032595 RepID=UPI0023DC3EE6|nr:copper homeostasis protein CutC [Aliiglaciecola sp. CAU 1673]MDF2178602.1 copper homeostasis protein CutC [Aliiglaciecola sp. CAU 1673]